MGCDSDLLEEGVKEDVEMEKMEMDSWSRMKPR